MWRVTYNFLAYAFSCEFQTLKFNKRNKIKFMYLILKCAKSLTNKNYCTARV